MKKISNKFPKDFLWGSATSAYQVEGGNKNSDWEVLGPAFGLPKAGKAADHYNRFEDDFEIAKSLSHDAHRLSIEWARIEPEKGKFDDREIEHYRAVLTSLATLGITPLVTLHHFTNPVWFAERGGWENPSSVLYFTNYVRFAVSQLQDLCNFWITINEPWVYVSEGYLFKRWLPMKFNPLAALAVGQNLARAHRGAYEIIHEVQPKAKVGVAYSMSTMRSPVSFDPNGMFEREIVKRFDIQDFIGVNYYRSVSPIKSETLGVKDLPQNDLGWEIYPEGLHQVLVKTSQQFGLPIYITENGIADENDGRRAQFITDHLAAVHRAISDGADVRGYLYWSLLDNFEWARGFDPRFGLVEVDYKTQKRTIRPSAKVYAKIAKNNSL